MGGLHSLCTVVTACLVLVRRYRSSVGICTYKVGYTSREVAWTLSVRHRWGTHQGNSEVGQAGSPGLGQHNL